jgi:hypothetical protein
LLHVDLIRTLAASGNAAVALVVALAVGPG